MHGQFVIYPGTDLEQVIPNNFLDEGEEAFLKMIAQGSVADVAAGGNFYIGLCGDVNDDTLTLATLTGEPAVSNGYAREAVTRDATGWPTISQVNGAWMARTAEVTFAASGGDFSTSIWRAFLCNVASGTSGKLFSISGKLDVAKLITDGTSFPMHYELFLT